MPVRSGGGVKVLITPGDKEGAKARGADRSRERAQLVCVAGGVGGAGVVAGFNYIRTGNRALERD